MPTQQRIQTTFEVELVDPETGDVKFHAPVNLSFPVDEPEPDLPAVRHAEAAARLRRLAAKGDNRGHNIPVEAFAELDWQVHVSKRRLVTIEVDEQGKPIPRGRK